MRWRIGLAASVLAAIAAFAIPAAALAAEAPANMMGNGGFELGRQFWTLDTAGGTVAKFDVNNELAAEGENSAVITIDKVEDWGVQFGQSIEAGKKGKTYTFAAVVRSTGDPVKMNLQIERRAQPYDRAAATEIVAVKKDQWTELHVTFKVEKEFPQGWFAYVECTQPKCQFRVDMVRLYEGEFVPYTELKKADAARAGVVLYDTASPAAAPLEGPALAKPAAWNRLAEDTLDHAFKGDAVMMNNRLAVVLRAKGRGAEVYSVGQGGGSCRAVIRPAAAGAGELASIKTLSNNPGEVSLEAAFAGKDSKPLAVTYTLRMGQVFVQVQGGPAVPAVRLEAPAQFAILPDFFADDIVIDAAELKVSRAQLPSENFFMHLLDGGAIAMAVWTAKVDDIAVNLTGSGAGRKIEASEIPVGGKDKAWVAVLEGPDMWYRKDVAKADAGKVVATGWTAPIPAMWRVDWRRADGLSDSWEMVTQAAGGFVKQGLTGSPDTIPASRKRWTTVLGSFAYPCWIDRDGKGFLQPLTSGAVRFDGPAILYPLGRSNATPLDAFTVLDIVRATLGVGPCEYILDVEGQQSQYKGRATCANRDTLNPIYQQHQQKAKRAEIEKSLVEVMIFIRHIRHRIEEYVDFSHQIAAYMQEQKKAHPELAKDLDELIALAAMPDKKVEARRESIKTPDQAQAMVDAFRRDGLDDDGPGAYDKCKKFTASIVEIGGNQDELVGECRWAIKVLRQRAGLLMAADGRLADVAKEIRAGSQKVLRSPAGHEGARH